MPVTRKSEDYFELIDDAGKKHRIKQTVIQRQASGLLISPGESDVWEELSRSYALDNGTAVRPNDDEDETYTALTKPPTKLRQLKPRI